VGRQQARSRYYLYQLDAGGYGRRGWRGGPAAESRAGELPEVAGRHRSLDDNLLMRYFLIILNKDSSRHLLPQGEAMKILMSLLLFSAILLSQAQAKDSDLMLKKSFKTSSGPP